MLDRTLPFFNTLLRCDHYCAQKAVLPDGFSIVPYRRGDEKAWAQLECAIGDFDSLEDAESYFVKTYLQDARLQDRIFFLVNDAQKVIGSCIAWSDPKGAKTVASLHWLVVDEAYHGRGLGRALCHEVMNLFAKRGELPVYIHTQPWSWKAILLYLSLGFRLQKTDSFSHYENEYSKAIATLKGIIPPEQFELLLQSSDP